MKLALASGSVACWGIAQHQPPAKVTDPLPPPSWVGMRTTPMVSLHSGQGLGASSVQFWEIQEPSMTIPSPPSGRIRSEERRVGKEGRGRRSVSHGEKNQNKRSSG